MKRATIKLSLFIMFIVCFAFGNEIDADTNAVALLDTLQTDEVVPMILDATQTDLAVLEVLDTLQPLDTSQAVKERRQISLAGPAISLVIPGGGQIYQRRYFAGAMFLAAEAIILSYGMDRWNESQLRNDEAEIFRNIARYFAELGEDSTAQYNAGLYNNLAEHSKFEARELRYTAYSAAAWGAGLYLYNVLDALEHGGLSPRGKEKNPTAAGFLAAVPFLGLGQFYNERPGKAGMMIMTQTSLMIMAYGHHDQMNRAQKEFNKFRNPESPEHVYSTLEVPYWRMQYDRNFSRRNTYLWVSLVAYIYSIFDAVVDAHLSDFNERINIGTDLAVAPNGGTTFGVKLSIKY